MPRRLMPFASGQYYHIYNRGNNRQAIFFEPENYLFFLRGLKKYICPTATVIAYCLMPTHYHLLVRIFSQDDDVSKQQACAVFSRAMQKFMISYTKSINKRFSRVGALFQGAFQSKLIDTYPYLINLCLYIHGNPVKDGLVAQPEDWQYSNYLEWMGERKGKLVDQEFIQQHFESPQAYQALLIDYLRSRNLPDDLSNYLQSLDA